MINAISRMLPSAPGSGPSGSHDRESRTSTTSTIRILIDHAIRRVPLERAMRASSPARGDQPSSTWAAAGRIVSAITIDAMSAKVLVYARGLKSLPSAAVIVNTGRNPTTVVATAVSTAPPTSMVAS